MRNLTSDEIQFVNGAGIIGDAWDDIRRIATELNDFYKDLISETADLMCTATGKC